MVSDKLVKKWLSEGLIDSKQYNRMLADIKNSRKDNNSKRLIITFSTVGALLLGLAAILFIGSNWQLMPDFVKFLMMALATGTVLFTGHYLRYRNNNYPHVGNALLFLSSLLFGATIIITAQIYNWSANSHWLVLLWMLGIAPLVYAFNNKLIAVLLGVLFLIWMGLVIFMNQHFDKFRIIPSYYVIGALLLSLGSLHYLKKEYSGIARIYRLLGLKTMFFSLFLLTFEFASRVSSYGISGANRHPGSVTVLFVLVSVMTIILMFINLFFNFNPAKLRTIKYEVGVGLPLLVLIMLFFFIPATTIVYTVLFNLVFAGLIILLLYLGISMKDDALLNMGISYLGIFLFFKYFDLFFRRLSISLFMFVGGAILVLGGFALEKKRREIREGFKKQKDDSISEDAKRVQRGARVRVRKHKSGNKR